MAVRSVIISIAPYDWLMNLILLLENNTDNHTLAFFV